ncbi:VPLPA-CTERM sorting domain-containing protein [Algirhabdus cladophorae]|uniref:VPLPA-CTERM sorting domain-containing protein n=1 Tax=Algirhabdus cladophorae TaxID=3377108 RepID=UPI003B849C33
MKTRTLLLATACALSPMMASAASITFTESLLQTVTPNATNTEATATAGGVTLTAKTTDGRVDYYDDNGGGGNGLYIGAIIRGENYGTSTSAPTSGKYELNFDKAINSISFEFDWLTNRDPAEAITGWATEFGSIDIDYTSLRATDFDDTTDTITSTGSLGSGIVTYSGAAFTSLFFDHTQAARNIGFVINEITISPVPVPASLPLALAGFGIFGVIRRKQRQA